LKRLLGWLLLQSLLINICVPLNAFSSNGEGLATSSIAILSNVDGAVLYIDGKNSELQTPLADPVTVTPGFHRFALEKEGHTSWRQELLLSPGEAMTFTAVLLPLDVTDSQKEAFKGFGKKPVTKRWWFWAIVLAGLGAAIAADDVNDEGTVRVTW